MLRLYRFACSLAIVVFCIIHTPSTAGTTGNKALSLDGANSLLDVQFDRAEAPVDNFTISVWVKPRSTISIPQSSNMKGGPPSSQKLLLISDGWYGYGFIGVGMSVGSNGVVIYENGYRYGRATLSYRDTMSDWTQITLVYKNRQPALYVNGSFVSRGLTSEKRSVRCFPIKIGGSSNNKKSKYEGLIDDFALWSRSLTSDEIAKNYREQFGSMDSGLVLYYGFNRANGDGTIEDNSNNGHTGTFVNGASLEDAPSVYDKPETIVAEKSHTQSDIDSITTIAKTKRPDGIAIVIGIEKYKNAPPATFAKQDALTFEKYAHKALGIPTENIYTLTDEEATLGEFMKLFGENGYLARRTNENTDIFIYYSGHGAPDLKTKMLYLIPADVDPDYPTTGYSTQKLYDNLGSLNANSITIFLDACFSGATRSNEMLLANARPIRIELTKSAIPENLTVLTASSGAQISSGYPSEGHGLFSYYLMKGLLSFSDGDSDSRITIDELFNYIKENVSKTAGKLDREQTPELITSDPDQVLVQY